MKGHLLGIAAAAALVAAPAAQAQDELTIGMITTLSGPGSGLGIDIRDGFMLGMEHLGPVPIKGIPLRGRM
jgi:branched-chain amino acid transport system substrate-binding protein